ncbi:MAG: hypothetical protein SVP52_09665 [Chloroflexota bacterium]|nr:hypothetical protein [Chloroflexota bacterium]
MPAVNPTRLKGQIEELLDFFYAPKVFRRRLQDLCSLYANRSLHHGDMPQPQPVSPMYHLPPPLIRQLQMDLKPHILKDPQAAFELGEELWNDSHFEIKQLAVYILGNTPIEEPDLIVEQLENCLDPDLDEGLKSTLLSTGTLTLQNKFPIEWENFLQSLLNHSDPKMIGFGIQGLQASVERTNFNNFPMAFRLLSPRLQNPDPTNMEELENLIEILIRQSPTETAFFLKQTLSISRSPETAKLIKRCLPLFPESVRQDLKSSLEG